MKKMLKGLAVLLLIILVVDIYTTIAFLKLKNNKVEPQDTESETASLIVEREYQEYIITLLQKIASLEQEVADLKAQITSEDMVVDRDDKYFEHLQQRYDMDSDKLNGILELREKQVQLNKRYQQKKKVTRCLEQGRQMLEKYIMEDKALEQRIKDILGYEDYLNYYYEFHQDAAWVGIILNSLMNEFGSEIYTSEEWALLKKELLIEQWELYDQHKVEVIRGDFDSSAFERQSHLYKKILEQNLLTVKRFLSLQQFEYVEKVLNREYDILVKVNEVNMMNADVVMDEYHKRYETGECTK